mgnify:CR=1 FL=1
MNNTIKSVQKGEKIKYNLNVDILCEISSPFYISDITSSAAYCIICKSIVEKINNASVKAVAIDEAEKEEKKFKMILTEKDGGG